MANKNNEEYLEEAKRLNGEMDEVFRRIAAAKAKLASYEHKPVSEVKKQSLPELFKTSPITAKMAINVIMGSICAGILFMIIYGQIYGCSTGCGGGQ